jgi:hypothetical protein
VADRAGAAAAQMARRGQESTIADRARFASARGRTGAFGRSGMRQTMIGAI